jgi:hypothetical protein
MKFIRKSIFIKISLLISFCCCYSTSFTQFTFEYSDNIPVTIGVDTINFAWSGGFNNVQFSTLDYDFDGDDDLFVFDRSSNNIRLFAHEITNGTSSYKFIYNGKNYFPTDINYRVALVDFNQDGKKDIFTYGIGGIKVYRNDGDNVNGLQWTLFKSLVYSNYTDNLTNLYVSSSDVPAIADVDFDGDIDILTFSIGGQHVEYHQNQSIEKYGIPDSLDFELKNECWGKFMEDAFSSSILLNDPNYPCINSNVPPPVKSNKSDPSVVVRHSGSTILAMDIDHSGVMDLIIGDVSTPNLNLLINGGIAPNTNSAISSIDTQFPSNSTPVNIQTFPAAFWEDVDFDSKKDLIVSGNARNSANNQKSVWFYKNNGTNQNPIFNYQMDDFLQHEMIDVGSGSIPVFFDYDQDGLEDLFVSNFYRYKSVLQKEGSIAYYRNTGTLTAPKFTFVSDDFLNLTQANYNIRFVPTFGDIDNDGDKDLFLGLEDGTIAYYQNINSTTLTFAAPILNYTDHLGANINTGSFNFPQLFDLNKDGLLDLILGKNSGEIIYYQNIGTNNSPSFKLINSNLGMIDIDPNSSSDYPTPHFFNFNDTTYLFSGAINGQLYFYDSIETNLQTGNSFHLVSNDFLNIPTEAYSSFFVNDINHNGKLDLFVGQDLGGLYHLEVDPNSSASLIDKNPEFQFTLYPNPNNGYFTIHHSFTNDVTIKIYDILGNELSKITTDKKEIPFELTQLKQGYYFVQLLDSNNVSIGLKKIIITN